MNALPTPAAQAALLDEIAARVARLIEQQAQLRDILAQLASSAETLAPGTVASILLLDKEGLLRNGASPNLPADYLDAIDRLRPDRRWAPARPPRPRATW